VSREDVWAKDDGVGTGFYRRSKNVDGLWAPWEFFPWLKARKPATRKFAEVWVTTKNKISGGIQYALVQCRQCHVFHNQSDWVGAICDDCPTGDYQMIYPMCSKCSVYINVSHGGGLDKPALCKNCTMVKAQATVSKAKAMGLNPPLTIVRKVGEVWELNSANAPFNSRQWGYQGTAKEPYVVTHYFARVDGSTTGDGWACSCMSFTRNVPRTPCKHILHVMLQNGVVPKGVSVKAAKVTSVLTDADAAEFEKWKREQAEKKDIKPTAGNELALFGATGRRFR
jgi:hypothetical protein